MQIIPSADISVYVRLGLGHHSTIQGVYGKKPAFKRIYTDPDATYAAYIHDKRAVIATAK